MVTMNVGARIVSDGHFATVKYVGEIKGTNGEWLGVEWDDSNRGKHNGMHDGVQYFTTKHPKSGSFLRPRKANFGVSLMTALKGRYGLIDDASAGVDTQEMFVVGENNKHTTVEVVGAQSVNKLQSQFDRLLEISLREGEVSDAGTSGEIRSTVPRVEELDLSKNLLNSWQMVAKIGSELAHLKSLNLSENCLEFPDKPSDLSQAFTQLRTIYLNRMQFTWTEILRCTEMLQGLHELHACYNQITSIPHTGPHLHQIKLLNLEANPIQGWNQILNLGKLAHLETLILNKTGIDRVEFPDVPHGKKSALFPRLSAIFISNNQITEWGSIDELNKLQSLTELTFKNNPVLQKYPDENTPRTIIVAKIAKLKLGNRTVVTKTERKGSQLDYMKMNGKAWRESGGHQDPSQNKPSEAFLQLHPRYQELVDLYGPPEDSELKEASTALKGNLINVEIRCTHIQNKPAMKKKLPLTMTVQKLKTLVQRLYKADPITTKVSYTSREVPGSDFEMDTDQKEIGYYSIEEGDTINISW